MRETALPLERNEAARHGRRQRGAVRNEAALEVALIRLAGIVGYFKFRRNRTECLQDNDREPDAIDAQLRSRPLVAEGNTDPRARFRHDCICRGDDGKEKFGRGGRERCGVEVY